MQCEPRNDVSTSPAVAVLSLCNEAIAGKRFREIQNQSSLSPNDFSALFNGILVIVRSLMRQPLESSKHEIYRKQLITGMRYGAIECW